MGKLTYEELILLDDFIYLEWNAKEDELLIDIVNSLLNDENFYDKMESMQECTIKMEKNEWITILKQVINKPNLQKLKIKNVNSNINGAKSACFIDDENNVTVVFRGTITANEWEDNGDGAYEYETAEQIDALNYINNFGYNNITVTGHSKGGNKAQYVTILSPKVDVCVSVNGQGFSNEFISKYNEKINKNKFKIISINAKYDYVNCLLNSISEKVYYIETEIQINPFYYHKANILLDNDGNLRQVTKEAMFSKIINHFSEALISNLPKNIKYLFVNKIIDIIELILCKKESDPLKTMGKVLIMFFYENNLNYPNIFDIIYPISEILILPLLFWNDFVSIEEGNSKELLDDAVWNINMLETRIIRKLEIANKDSKQLINGILNAVNELIYKLLVEKN